MNEKYIWYASYGSNLNKERFLCYIQGGSCHYNSVKYDGCTNKSDPITDRPITIPYQLYFGNTSDSWKGSGVAFLAPQKDLKANTLGRMYLITEEQFNEIRKQEGRGSDWYGEVLELGEVDGYMVKTFTNANIRPINMPNQLYLRAMTDGLKQAYPNMQDFEIRKYYYGCMEQVKQIPGYINMQPL